jgi:hypothetical protein
MGENRHGLSRDIPADVARDVRRRSKFGCVRCRSGFYVYEHIDPPFKDAREHRAEAICCLCASCHDAVTRGQLAKSTVKAAYDKIQAATIEEAGRPRGPLDFTGGAELIIGGLSYHPAVNTVLRYHGRSLIQLHPASTPSEQGSISAVFTDSAGREALWLDAGHWIGSLAAWDIDVEGQRIAVRTKRGDITLQLRLDPPGRILVERLDMRYRDVHILATDKSYAAGRYIGPGLVLWSHANVIVNGSGPEGAAIEFASPGRLARRIARATGKSPASSDGDLAIVGGVGVMIKSAGVSIASNCGSFHLLKWAVGSRPVDAMRSVLISQPEQVTTFIATGKTRPEG